MAKLRFTPAAENDLTEIAAYIADASGSREVAEAFIEKLYNRCQKLAALPVTMGRERSDIKPGIRSVPFGNYVIFFRYGSDAFEVVNVLEGHRDIPSVIKDVGEPEG